MAVSPIPYRTDFLEKDKDGKPTGKVSWWWIKWFMEMVGQVPVDPNALIALTIGESPPVDVAEQAAAEAILASQPEPPSIDAVQVEELAGNVALMLEEPPLPLPEYVDGPFVKSQSITTGSVGASTYASVTLIWTTPFWDATYRVYASVLQSTTSQNTLRVHHVESLSATQVVVGVFNDDAGGAHTGTLHVLGIHN